MPVAMSAGLSYSDFWSMTIGEVKSYLERYAETQRANNYSLAAMVAGFVSCTFSGKQIPSFEEMSGQKSGVNTALIKEQLIDFAEGRNKQGVKNGTN